MSHTRFGTTLFLVVEGTYKSSLNGLGVGMGPAFCLGQHPDTSAEVSFVAVSLMDCSFSRAFISQTRFSSVSTPGCATDAQSPNLAPLHLKIHASLLIWY